MLAMLPKPKSFDRLKIYFKSHWKELTLLTVFVGAAVLLIYTLWLQKILFDRPGQSTQAVAHQADETKKPSPLTGLLVLNELADQRVLGVMIENLYPDARPQSGLSQAGMVFETVAEGGITRYLALFQETRPAYLGPVRSLRPYYLDWAMGFDAAIAHAGGSGAALYLVQQRHAKSMNGLIYSQGYWRTGDRPAPHNLYTSGQKLDDLAKQLGYKGSTYTPYQYTQHEEPATNPTAKTITFNFSSSAYIARFKYDRSNNQYLRFLNGTADKDKANHKQITVKNLIWIKMPVHYEGQYAVMDTTSKGSAVIFRDGRAIRATWKKTRAEAQLELLDASGQPILLNPGHSWFAVVPSGNSVTY